MLRIETIVGRALPLGGADIDTDRIIPARYLKTVSFAGLERHVFEDDRRAAAASGGRHPFDEPAYQPATILVTGRNFGCGSSREHAPQALHRWGIRAVVAESFSEIFFGNALAIGMPCLAASAEDLARVLDAVEQSPACQLVISITDLTLTWCSGSALVDLPFAARDAFVSGSWDALGMLIADPAAVGAVAGRLPYVTGNF